MKRRRTRAQPLVSPCATSITLLLVIAATPCAVQTTKLKSARSTAASQAIQSTTGRVKQPRGAPSSFRSRSRRRRHRTLCEKYAELAGARGPTSGNGSRREHASPPHHCVRGEPTARPTPGAYGRTAMRLGRRTEMRTDAGAVDERGNERNDRHFKAPKTAREPTAGATRSPP